jgi:hypothetical protein
MKIITSIASTTHVDRHGERMTKGALEDMANQVNSKYIPFLIDHDFDQQIGILIFGKVTEVGHGEYALMVISGVFETKEEFFKYPIGSDNLIWKNYSEYLSFVPEDIRVVEEFPIPQTLEQKLEAYLDSTKILPNGDVYRIKHFVTNIGDLQVHVWPKDHDHPEHFHVISKQRNIDARFDLNSLEFLSNKSGVIRKKDIKIIKKFFQQNYRELSNLREKYRNMHL